MENKLYIISMSVAGKSRIFAVTSDAGYPLASSRLTSYLDKEVSKDYTFGLTVLVVKTPQTIEAIELSDLSEEVEAVS